MAAITKIEKNLFAVEGVILFSNNGSEAVSRGFRTLAKATEYAKGLDRNNANVTASRAERRAHRLEAVNSYLAARKTRVAADTSQMAFAF